MTLVSTLSVSRTSVRSKIFFFLTAHLFKFSMYFNPIWRNIILLNSAYYKFLVYCTFSNSEMTQKIFHLIPFLTKFWWKGFVNSEWYVALKQGPNLGTYNLKAHIILHVTQFITVMHCRYENAYGKHADILHTFYSTCATANTIIS